MKLKNAMLRAVRAKARIGVRLHPSLKAIRIKLRNEKVDTQPNRINNAATKGLHYDSPR